MDALEAEHISKVLIPLLENKNIQKRINDLVLEANQKRYQAFVLEQDALKLVNDMVIYAQ